MMELDAVIFKITIILWGLSESPTITNGARILGIFPVSGKSHFSFNEAMMRSLHNAGHEITFVSPFGNENSLKNYSVINIAHNIPLSTSTVPLSSADVLNLSTLISEQIMMAIKFCEFVLGSSEIQALMKSKDKNYDVVFIEYLVGFQCYLPLAEKLNIPVIGTTAVKSWSLADAAIGNPNHHPVFRFHAVCSEEMTFLIYLKTLGSIAHLNFINNVDVPRKLREVYNKFYTPDLLNKKQVSLMFVNNHLSLMPRSIVPNTIDVGGISVEPAKSLPKNYQIFIDEAKDGVILLSFGTVLNSSSLHPDVIVAFRDAFAAIPQRVIWKFDGQIKNLSDNIMLGKWIPQRDILAHRNVKAFITHCGISGINEGLIEGVPMILTPVILDQNSNAALLEKLGVGLPLNIYSATKEKVLAALNSIINDTRYRDKMKELSARFKDRPMSPQESVVYWTEYVIRHNSAPYLRSNGSDMPLYQYFLLDITAAIIITTTFSLYIGAKVIKRFGFSLF